MIKKLSMIVIGIAVLGFCMAAAPQGKAEAGQVYHAIQHYYQDESGRTGIRDVKKDFTTNEYARAYVDMGKIKMGKTTAWVSIAGDSDSKNVRVWPWKTVIRFTFD